MTVKDASGTAKTKTQALAAMSEITPDENKVYAFTDTVEWFQHETLPGHTTIDGDRQLAFSPGGHYTLAEINDFYPAAIVDNLVVKATGAAPTALPAAGGTILRMTGDNLTGVTAITFGGTAAALITIVDRYTIDVTTPAKAAGTYTVAVTDDSGSVTDNFGLTNGVTFV